MESLWLFVNFTLMLIVVTAFVDVYVYIKQAIVCSHSGWCAKQWFAVLGMGIAMGLIIDIFQVI